MTKKEMEYLVKRYRFIIRAVKNDLPESVFYVGNKKFTIPVTQEVKTVCEIVNMVYNGERNDELKRIIKGIMTGETDKCIMRKIFCEKNAYYQRKDKAMDKLFNVCVYRNLVTFEEILLPD